jgi:glycosyltransferase involved in cell wall biosynthesis
MKILFDYQIFLNQEYGGPSRYFVNLAKAIIKKETLKICAPIHINNYLQEIPKNFIYGLKLPKQYSNYFPYKIKSIINKFLVSPLNKRLNNLFSMRYNPDIVHKTYYDSENRINKPTVLTVYDLIHEKFYKDYNKSKFYRPKKKALENADKIICISKNTSNDLIKYYDVDKKKIEIIYLANSFSNIACNLPPTRVVSEIKKDYLLYVGKRSGYKNFLNFIKAFSISSKLKRDFCIICFGNREFTRDEINEFSKLKLNDKNIIHINGDDFLLSHLYKNARALIYPSLYEGFGLPILEAMSFNCPVICSNTSSIPEVGGDAVKYFNPYDITEISQIICNTVYSDYTITSLINKGKIQEKLFTWQKCSENTLKVYKKLL